MPSPSDPSERTRAHAADRRRNKGEPRPRREDGVSTDETVEERAVLIGIGPARAGLPSDEVQLDELARLAITAGAEEVGRLWQRRPHPEVSSYLGSGKLDELDRLCKEREATLVIADHDLSPAQVRSMEKALDLRVIDRSELIIHIFVLHAGTRQSRLQVELAQLQYLAPRLKRMWTHLSRITGAGGIGSRGPGEKQIEVDRRIIQKRIQDLKRELAEIEARRERQVSSRSHRPTVSLVGYTNAGKSTLMRALSGSEVFIADQLFATLDTRTRRWSLASGSEILLSDTVGFIDKLPHHLVASFHATLAEVRSADLLLHVVDASDPDARDRVSCVRDVLRQIGADHLPEALVLNKCDLIPDPVHVTILAEELEAEAALSAHTRRGLDDLERVVEGHLGRDSIEVLLRIPASDGRALAEVERLARVHSRHFEEEACTFSVRVRRHLLPRFERWIVQNGAS